MADLQHQAEALALTALSLQKLSVTLGKNPVLRDLDLTIHPGECVGLIGPNGAGKSTLMRAALGLIPSRGRSSLASLPPSERARAAAWLPQTREIAWDLDVATVVALGRTPYRRLGVPLSEDDQAAISDALAKADVASFADRRVGTLSGGEQARVLLARALAQKAPLILADEPVAALDPAHQIATMETFAAFSREGRTVITALHDLGLAARWCTRLILLNEGRVFADGPPSDVLTLDNLRAVYGVEVHLEESAGGLIVQPLSRTT
ncbi:MAG: ABC transporter ATP-binding protein [Pseudomonadota bacterium]